MTPDDDLQQLLHRAVDGVEPADRLGDIRRRTAQPPGARRRWPIVVLGAGLATASVVAVAALASHLGSPPGPPPAAPTTREVALAAYFPSDTVDGTRLFREFHLATADPDDGATALAALRLLEADAGPADPDYTTTWPEGAFVTVAADADQIVVEVASGLAPTAVMLQQAVLTAQGAVGRTVPVTVTSASAVIADGLHRDQNLLAPVNISDPTEGHEVDDLLTLRGTVNTEARDLPRVRWSLLDDVDEVVDSGLAPTQDGTWDLTTDIAGLPTGAYELVVQVRVAGLTFTDTRNIAVR